MSDRKRPKLSICIPTFNRAEQLNETLGTLGFANELPIEIVVSDNASTDRTEQVVRDMMGKLPTMRYVRQKSNTGLMPNHAAPFRLALGEFSVFLADDDRIEIEPLWELVELLEVTPDLVACFAGWHEWDHFQKRSVVRWIPVNSPHYFDHHQGRQLLDFVARYHVFPEIGVYRTEVINKVRFQLHRTWAFHWWMWNYLRFGRICFHPNVFYEKAPVFGSGQPNKDRAGNKLSVELIDEYRASAESILFGAMLENATLPVPPEHRIGAMHKINEMANARHEVAGRLSRGRGDFIASYEFYSRLLLWQEIQGETVADLERTIAPNAAVEALIDVFEQTPGAEEIAVCDFGDPSRIVQTFHRMREELPVRVRSTEELLNDLGENRIIVVERPESVAPFVAAGVPPGLVYSFDETRECYRMQPQQQRHSGAESRGERGSATDLAVTDAAVAPPTRGQSRPAEERVRETSHLRPGNATARCVGSPPKLSICIPTFNRAELLNETLNTLSFANDLPIEIIVSDNASTDRTEQVVRDMMGKLPMIRYVRQESNTGLMPNYAATFRLALGEFSVFLADDDRIDIEPLWELVELLEATSDLVACFTGWHEWDDSQKQPLVHWAPIAEPRYFDRRQAMQLFDFVARDRLFPEIGVFRTKVINKVRFQARKTWAFHWWIWNCLRFGRICFHSNVFYKNTLIFSSGKQNTERSGNRLSVEAIDEYRAGAESILFGAMLGNASLPVPPQNRARAMQQVNAFANARVGVAARLSRGQQNFIASYEFYSRFLLWQDTDDATIADLERAIAPGAAVQALIEVFEQTPNTDQIAVCDFADPIRIVQAFRRIREDVPIRVASREELLNDSDGRHIIVVERPESVSAFVSAGIPSGRIYSLEETCKCFRMRPKHQQQSVRESPVKNEAPTASDVSAWTREAIACYRAGDLPEARRHAHSVLGVAAPARDKAACHQLLGAISHRERQFDQAVVHLQHAVVFRPDVPELRKGLFAARIALARQRRRQSRLAEAEGQVREALRLQPGDPDAQNILGVVLHERQKLDEARHCFQQALKAAPRHPSLRLNYAELLCALREFEEAIEEYEMALALRPNHVKTLLCAGAAMLDARRSRQASQLLERALQLDDANPDVRFNLGNAYVLAGKLAAAAHQFGEALRLRPNWAAARANWLRHRAETCDWRDDWQTQLQTLLREVTDELNAGRPSPVNISQALAFPFPGTTMRRIACRQTELLRQQHTSRDGCPTRPNRDLRQHDRLRIGYLSHDFRDHAIGHLTRSMFRHHDRDEIEVFTYSCGPDDGSEYRRAIQCGSEHFCDYHGRSDSEITKQIAADSIDILVDIGGYAKGCRPEVLLSRPAPVLVHYLGFPGTLGGLVDYFVTDPTLTPEGDSLRDEFEESLVYLPNTYQMTDDRQPISEQTFSREQCGLPPVGFVFAAFSNNYKIQPDVFDTWMRILGAVPSSVLWLLRCRPQVVENLRGEARRRGVESDRLVFCDKMSKPEHLSRLRLVDLFLDTTVYGAHTTASDALWSGIPLITCLGQRFAERVAASLLATAGLQELIAGDLVEYEQLAIDLAAHPARLQGIRDDWSRRRGESRLFDTAGRVRQLEQAYVAIWQRHCDGLPPHDITDVGDHDRPSPGRNLIPGQLRINDPNCLSDLRRPSDAQNASATS